MPRGDRTGPDGMGPMTGRGFGFCAGHDRPGYIVGGGRGFGRGGGRGYGRGMAWRRGWGGRGYYEPPYPMARAYRPTREEEKETLTEEIGYLKEEIEALQKHLEGLEEK